MLFLSSLITKSPYFFFPPQYSIFQITFFVFNFQVLFESERQILKSEETWIRFVFVLTHCHLIIVKHTCQTGNFFSFIQCIYTHSKLVLPVHINECVCYPQKQQQQISKNIKTLSLSLSLETIQTRLISKKKD